MPLSPTANLILYVPFTDEYPVSNDDIRQLDIDTFFKECFVAPHLDKNIKELLEMPETEIGDPEYPLTRENFISKFEEGITQRESFLDWIKGSSKGIYLFRGDAGTGKTTYVHYLKWYFKDINWKIIDLQRAREKILIMGYRIKFNKFSSLHRKVISALIDKVISILFPIRLGTSETKTSDIYRMVSANIQKILYTYKMNIRDRGLLNEYNSLYRSLEDIAPPINGEELEYCKRCAKIVTEYFTKMCITDYTSISDALDCAVIHYMVVLNCVSPAKKVIIVFDNLERFIGVHEIFSEELIDFIANLRSLVDTYKDLYFDSIKYRNKFAENFQLIVSMRNTSARNFTPLQNADFFESSIDLSEWFSIDEIVQKKFDWFNKSGISVDNSKRLKNILSDFGVAKGGTIRGLRPKLNLIFNFDKRLTVDFLVEMTKSFSNKDILKTADILHTDTFVKNGSDYGLGAFSYRSIIWRLVIDKLNRGAMFRYIFNKRNSVADTYIDITYTRNILTILSNYNLEHHDRQYMPLEDLVCQLYHMTGNADNWFDNLTWKVEREKVTQLLYYMNYFNRRENNWFQFLDIQCNDTAYDKFHFEKWQDLLWMIESRNASNRRIGVRITNAGKAYVGYMVQTFEFISCVSGITTPLLCCIPSEQDLLTKDIDSLQCINLIKQVFGSIDCYIRDDNPNILYERPDRTAAYSYTNRLINSHIGYIDNFRRCIDYLFAGSKGKLSEKRDGLIQKLGEITTEYRKKYKLISKFMKFIFPTKIYGINE